MTIKKYTYIDDFFIRKTDEIPAHFSEHINRGFKKKLMRGSTAKDLFVTAIKEYFNKLNQDLINELEKYEHENKFENSLDCYQKNIHIIHQEILDYLERYLNNCIRTQKEKDYIYNYLNTQINDSIKNWNYTIEKKQKTILQKIQEFISLLLPIIKIFKP